MWERLIFFYKSGGGHTKSSPKVLSAILYGISSWRKGPPPSPTTSLTSPTSRSFKNQAKIVWLQSLMSLMAYNWAIIKNLYLQPFGAKTTGKICAFSLIQKLWGTTWCVWNYRNYTLNSPDVTTKTDMIRLINKRTTYHLNRGTTGLPL